MKKIINFLKWAFLLGVLIGFPLMIILTASSVDDFLANKDTIAVLGEGKYEIGIFPHGIALEDYRFDGRMKILVGTIEKYNIKDNTIYVVGDYGGGWVINKDGIKINPSDYYVYETGERKFYEPDDPVAHYVILNFEKDELRKYVNFEDIPKEDQQVFKK